MITTFQLFFVHSNSGEELNINIDKSIFKAQSWAREYSYIDNLSPKYRQNHKRLFDENVDLT